VSPPGSIPGAVAGSTQPAPLGPSELVAEARRYVRAGDPTAADGSWARVAAYLARQALEETLQQLWLSGPEFAGVERSSCRSQLTCLRQLAVQHEAESVGSPESALAAAPWISAVAATEAGWTWRSLCRACHVHPYELPPTAAELSEWIDAVERFVAGARPVLTASGSSTGARA
jgi:hypothetical protein